MKQNNIINENELAMKSVLELFKGKEKVKQEDRPKIVVTSRKPFTPEERKKYNEWCKELNVSALWDNNKLWLGQICVWLVNESPAAMWGFFIKFIIMIVYKKKSGKRLTKILKPGERAMDGRFKDGVDTGRFSKNTIPLPLKPRTIKISNND